MNGDHLVDIADLSVVWVWAQFYQDELPLLKRDLPMTVTTSSYPGEKFNGKISVIDPFISDTMRTAACGLMSKTPTSSCGPTCMWMLSANGHGRRRRCARGLPCCRPASTIVSWIKVKADFSRASSNSVASMVTSTKSSRA